MRPMVRTVALALVLLLAGCGPGTYHGPVAPTTDRNPFTGSTGGGGGR